jgi:hypothetical protein
MTRITTILRFVAAPLLFGFVFGYVISRVASGAPAFVAPHRLVGTVGCDGSNAVFWTVDSSGNTVRYDGNNVPGPDLDAYIHTWRHNPAIDLVAVGCQ